MKLELIKKEEQIILERMMQLYLHNISVFFPIPFNSKSGTYEYDDIEKYFSADNENQAFFIKKDKDICGFILFNIVNNINIIQEIFVLNNYKRIGIGKMAVEELFNRNKGDWEIKSLPGSEPAEKFWISVVKSYTSDNFNIEYVGKYNRVVIRFNNGKYE